MNRGLNEAMGWMAVLYVRFGGIRANNYLDANKMSEQEWNKLTACIETVRANSSDIVSSAEQAMKHQCGNCQEQTSVVIAFLMKVGMRQIDQMVLYGDTQFAHTFVVLGRRTGSRDWDISSWGPDAVVIDAWHNKGSVYPASELESKGFRGYHKFHGPLTPKSVLRVN